MTTLAENSAEIIESLGNDAKADFKKNLEILHKTRSNKAVATRSPAVNYTPEAIKSLAPQGAYIVRVLSCKVYQGCHRLWNRHRWVARRWEGTRTHRSEVDALNEVVDWLWRRHSDAGHDSSARPTRGTVLAQWLALTQPPPVVAAVAPKAKPKPKPKAKGKALAKPKAKAKVRFR